MPATPVSLLDRVCRLNEAGAWERLVQLYTPLLHHWARRLGLDPEQAGDLVQDVFTVLVQKLPEFRYDPAKRFRGWLWTITVNRFRERQRRPPELVLPPDPLAAAIAVPDDAIALAEEEYRQYLTRRALVLMQAVFQPATWKAFWEVVVHERRAGEVARELGMSENAVYLAKGRVLRRLRTELEGLLD
jgi:RNA polymerase sigma-70 factor (ECF subfamily)